MNTEPRIDYRGKRLENGDIELKPVVRVDVMGTEYEIIYEEKDFPISGQKEQPDEYDGYIDFTSKRIYVTDLSEDYHWENVEEHRKRIVRHELVHAFLHESGLSTETWADNEEIVDWIALQFPKMAQVFEQLDI